MILYVYPSEIELKRHDKNNKLIPERCKIILVSSLKSTVIRARVKKRIAPLNHDNVRSALVRYKFKSTLKNVFATQRTISRIHGQNIDVEPLHEQWLTIWKEIQTYWTLNYTKEHEMR